MRDIPDGRRSLAAYRPWFYAAAVYNAVWGTATILFPHAYFELIGMGQLDQPAFWRVVGMLLLIYAPAFWWVARNPWRHPHLVLIATAGKVLGPIGFLAAYLAGELPGRFGLLMITNDLIWLPAFFLLPAGCCQDRRAGRSAEGRRFLPLGDPCQRLYAVEFRQSRSTRS